jgi:hypothetical protein
MHFCRTHGDYHNPLKSSGTTPNSLITLASLKSPSPDHQYG